MRELAAHAAHQARRTSSSASRPCSRSASSWSATSPTPSASWRSAAEQPGNGAGANGASAAVRTVGDVKLMARAVQGLNPRDLRGLVDDGKKQVGSGIVAIVGVTEDGKAGLAVGVTDGPHGHIQRRRPRQGRCRGAGRQGRRRPPRHGPGRRPRRLKAQAALEAIEAQLAG